MTGGLQHFLCFLANLNIRPSGRYLLPYISKQLGSRMSQRQCFTLSSLHLPIFEQLMGFSEAASPSTSDLAVLSVQTCPQFRKWPLEFVFVKKVQVAQTWSAQSQHSLWGSACGYQRDISAGLGEWRKTFNCKYAVIHIFLNFVCLHNVTEE